MMRILRLSAFLIGIAVSVHGQQKPSQYDPAALFAPQQYPQSPDMYRNAAGEPGPAYWQNKADYQISASLDEVKNEIRARVLITYRNNSPGKLPFIWLILEQNLFNPKSRGFAKAPVSGRSRYVDNHSSFQGGYHFESVKLLLQKNGKMEETTADTILSDTRMQVRLAKPLEPGEELKLRLEYYYTIPSYGADRTGVQATDNGKIFAVAQWYPRVCVYDDIRGWNTDPYLGAGEFYLEYGDFDVSLTAPADHVVVASGELQNPQEVMSPDILKRFNRARESDSTVMIRGREDLGKSLSGSNKSNQTWKFLLHNARDFAWASSSSFLWDGCRISPGPGKKAMVQSVYPLESGGRNAWGRSSEYTKGCLENYSKRWFEYPYPCAVNVASNISGMEYPGIVFCSWKDTGESLWSTTDHEFGHTWFPMVVGSNERRYGWMDEGFNTFLNMLSADDFNHGEYRQPQQNGQSLADYLTEPSREKVMLTPDGMQESHIGSNLYFKPGYALFLLRTQVLGPDRFDYAFRKYIRDWAYKHPSPWDFFRSMDNSGGEDLYWFWKSLFLENYRLDQGIVSVESNGLDNGSGIVIITLENLEKMAMPVVLELTTVSGKKIRRNLPVEIWQSSSRYAFQVSAGEKVRKVVIDPDLLFPDYNPSNNTWLGIK